jgi:hypothetical protein
MRQIRFRVRTMLILVFVVALGLGLFVLRSRSIVFHRRAAQAEWFRQRYAALASRWMTEAQEARVSLREYKRPVRQLEARVNSEDPWTVTLSPKAPDLSEEGNQEVEDLPRSVRIGRKLADHYAALQAKYERAARYPWLPVETYPPEPDL